MAPPISVKFIPPFPSCEIFAYRGGIATSRGDWYFAAYVVDRAKGSAPSLKEGIYIFLRRAESPDVALAVWPPRLDRPAGSEQTLRPITALSTGGLERGSGGSIHYVVLSPAGITFLPIEGPGAVD